jgi:hypothetical protein
VHCRRSRLSSKIRARHAVVCCGRIRLELMLCFAVPCCAVSPCCAHRLEERLRRGIMEQLEGVVLNGPADVEQHRCV